MSFTVLAYVLEYGGVVGPGGSGEVDGLLMWIKLVLHSYRQQS